MLKKFFKNERGLTLIELLAVIVILGIIAAIAVPSIGGLISKTEEDAAEAAAIQVLNSSKLYAASETIPEDGVTLELGGPLDQYLDNLPEDYSITIDKDTEGFTYTDISVTDNGHTKTYDNDADLLEGTETSTQQ